MAISFDLKELRSFVLVAEDLSFTSAAARLNTVQSAVSGHIANLEAGLGQVLVARGRGQRMSLTPEGQTFLVYAKRILALSEEAAETVQTSRARRILRLGTTVTLAMSLVPDALRAFAAARPDVQIQIQCDRSDQLLRRLEAGDVDMSFMMDQGRHATRRFVQSMDLIWVCSDTFALPEKGPVPLAFLTDGRDLRRYALEALDRAGREGHVSHLSPHPVGVRALVQAGLALTIMPARTVVAPLRQVNTDLNLPRLTPIALATYLGAREGFDGGEALAEALAAACLGEL